jgi:hypothetical protein
MAASSSSMIKNEARDGNVYIGVPLAQDDSALPRSATSFWTKSTYKTNGALLAICFLGMVMAVVDFVLVQLLLTAKFFIFGNATLSAVELLPFMAVANLNFAILCVFAWSFVKICVKDIDDATYKEIIHEALIDLCLLGYMFGHIVLVILYNPFGILLYSFLGLKLSPDSTSLIDVNTLLFRISLMLLWMLCIKMRDFNSLADDATRGSKAEPSDHFEYVRMV